MLSSPKMFWAALKFSHYFTIGLLNAENIAKYECGLHARDCGLLLKFAKPHSSKVRPGKVWLSHHKLAGFKRTLAIGKFLLLILPKYPSIIVPF